MNVTEIEKRVKAQLTESRYQHTLRVRDTARELCELLGYNSKKAELAALVHDYAKCMKKEDLQQKIKDCLPPDLLNYHHELWHGPVGSILIQDDFNITDEDIVNSVKYHTTGREGMSTLEKIVFVSDYIEPARDFPLLDEVRVVVKEDLTKAAFLVSRNTLSYLIKNNALVYPLSVHAYNDLQRQVFGGV